MSSRLAPRIVGGLVVAASLVALLLITSSSPAAKQPGATAGAGLAETDGPVRPGLPAAFASASPSSSAGGASSAAGSAKDVSSSVPPGTPTATHFNGEATVGPLFASARATRHGCTASVVDSPGGDVILTAAHCVKGTDAGTVFAPGYSQGKEPYGVWTVTGDHGAAGWLQGRSTQRDFAFLTVAPKTIKGKVTNIQDVTGGNQLGNSAKAGETVTVPAYAAGSDDRPLTCRTKVYTDDGYPAFNCNPYPGGTSGAPWLLPTPHGRVIVGVIGGLHQGGCYSYTSYSSAFSPATWKAYTQSAEAAASATFPAAGGDGC